ncbi:unnamed protein product [Nesidiocoris tenuis]|uniref:Uncharacterized protein n=1 Tax=Nesidiocoris tenuis TaxID=355587 RepID=A0A6H5HBI3_9HEMI|nr:unnamed protein product [Nesidiocoris tenuis]
MSFILPNIGIRTVTSYKGNVLSSYAVGRISCASYGEKGDSPSGQLEARNWRNETVLFGRHLLWYDRKFNWLIDGILIFVINPKRKSDASTSTVAGTTRATGARERQQYYSLRFSKNPSRMKKCQPSAAMVFQSCLNYAPENFEHHSDPRHGSKPKSGTAGAVILEAREWMGQDQEGVEQEKERTPISHSRRPSPPFLVKKFMTTCSEPHGGNDRSIICRTISRGNQRKQLANLAQPFRKKQFITRPVVFNKPAIPKKDVTSPRVPSVVLSTNTPTERIAGKGELQELVDQLSPKQIFNYITEALRAGQAPAQAIPTLDTASQWILLYRPFYVRRVYQTDKLSIWYDDKNEIKTVDRDSRMGRTGCDPLV